MQKVSCFFYEIILKDNLRNIKQFLFLWNKKALLNSDKNNMYRVTFITENGDAHVINYS